MQQHPPLPPQFLINITVYCSTFEPILFLYTARLNSQSAYVWKHIKEKLKKDSFIRAICWEAQKNLEETVNVQFRVPELVCGIFHADSEQAVGGRLH